MSKHNYAGPFTNFQGSIDASLKPIDLDDQLAMQHDYAYTNANNWDEINDADNAMIESLQHNNLKGDPHSAMVVLGLKGKGIYNTIADIFGFSP